MPLKLNVGPSKKIGLPDYGSLGASSVNLELELDSSAIGEPERLRQQIRHLFGQAKLSIEEELSRQQPGPQNGSGRNPRTNGNGNGHCQTTVLRARGGNGHHSRLPAKGRAATNGQVRAIRAITDRQGLDLGQLLGRRFRLQRLEEQSLADASALIDELKTHSTVDEGSR